MVVENFRPDVKNAPGHRLRDARQGQPPARSTAASRASARRGPYRDRPGYDQIAQGMGGLMSITGLPGQGPVRVGIPVADLTAGIFLAQGILVALLERERSGKGQWVHTSLLQAMVTMLDFQAARWLIAGEIPPQAGNDHPTVIPTGVFAHRGRPHQHRRLRARTCSAASARRSARSRCSTTRASRPRPTAPRIARRWRWSWRRPSRHEAERGLGGAAQRQGRALRPHPRRQGDVRERADPAPPAWRCR